MESGKDPDVGLNSLCVAYRVVAGTFDKKVFQLDVREDNRRIVYYRQCVLSTVRIFLTSASDFH
jgi:hypothetical protein